MNGWAVEVVHYTLDGTKTGSGSGYGTANDITQDGMSWKVTGNTSMNPWRIGGNSINKTDRPVYSTTAMGSAITKVELTVGTASSITVNSLKLLVYNNSDLKDTHKIDEVSKTFSASSTITFTPTSGTAWATGAYYKIVFNVTVSGSSNRFVQFTKAQFYKEGANVPITGITLPSTTDVPIGKTRTLTATVSPVDHTGTVVWESTNPSIATVTQEGVVTGVAIGNTTIKAKSQSDNTIYGQCSVTIKDDVATLPFNWPGGARTNLLALYGVTGNSLGEYTDNESNRPYLIQFNAVGDFILIKTNAQPGIVSVGVKMIGGNSKSKIKIQESADGSDYEDVQEFEISGNLNDIVNFATNKSFNSTSRYVRIYKSVHATGGNIGVGPISIAVPEAAAPTTEDDNIYLTTSNKMAGWRSFVSSEHSYRADANTTIYKVASSPSANKLKLESIDNIKKGTPVILKTSAPAETDGTFKITLTEIEDKDAKDAGTNLLKATTSVTDLSTTVYRLGYGTYDIGFYAYSSANAPAGIVYIDADDITKPDASRGVGMIFDNETTGIEAISNTQETVNASREIYNLNGQRVANPTKGLYIVNGKKVIIK